MRCQRHEYLPTGLPGAIMHEETANSFNITVGDIDWRLVSRWWRYHMDTFSASPAICAGNSAVTGEFPAQRPVTQSFDVFFDQRLNKRLSKQWGGGWSEKPSRPLWRHCNEIARFSNRHTIVWRWCIYKLSTWLGSYEHFIAARNTPIRTQIKSSTRKGDTVQAQRAM